MKKNKLFIVIVLYKQKLYDSISFITLTKAIKYNNPFKITLLVYDNSPTVCSYNIININGIDEIIFNHDTSNPGVSKAYNYAAQVAFSSKADWLLLLDQDTILSEKILFQYNQSIIANPKCKLFAPIVYANKKIISPYRVSYNIGWTIKKEVSGLISSKKYHAINSALLINVDYFILVKGYNDNIKLDFSDFVFFENYSRYSSFFYIVDVFCNQNLSTFETDMSKLIRRHTSFCTDALFVPKQNILDYISFFIIVLKRTISLTIRMKSLKFLKILWQKYLFQMQKFE